MTIEEVHKKYPTLTVRQLTILIVVAGGCIFTTRIAKYMDMFPSVISRNVHSLAATGLLTRTEERDDKNCQKFRLRLTKAGWKVIEDLD